MKDHNKELTLIIHYINSVEEKELVAFARELFKNDRIICHYEDDLLSFEKLTIDHIKKLMLKVREIEQKNPKRVIFCMIKGAEEKSVAEATEMMKEIFPSREKWLQKKRELVEKYYDPTIICPLCEFIRGTEQEVIDHIIEYHTEEELKNQLGWEPIDEQ